jgi:protein arginine kinase activator
MQCQLCGKRPAIVHFTEIVNNKKSEYHVCEKCAEERGYSVPLLKSKFSVGDLLAGMVDQTGVGEEAKVGRVQCPRCGLVYSSFRETGRLGCSECYTTFRTQLRPLLRRIHGSTKHVGKSPARDSDRVTLRREIQRLHEEMQRAIEREEFETAASLRDQIRTMENQEAPEVPESPEAPEVRGEGAA